MSDPKTCFDVWPLLKDSSLGVQFCCESCHEDVWHGLELLVRELPDGSRAAVCCTLAGELQEAGW